MSGVQAAASHVRTSSVVLVAFTASLLVPCVFKALRNGLVSLRRRFSRRERRALKQRRSTSPADARYNPWAASDRASTGEANRAKVAWCECCSEPNGESLSGLRAGNVQAATLFVVSSGTSCAVDAPCTQDSCSELSESSCESFYTCPSRITHADYSPHESVSMARLCLHGGDKDFLPDHRGGLNSSSMTGFSCPANEASAQARSLAFSEIAKLYDEEALCDCPHADDTQLSTADLNTLIRPEDTISYCVVREISQETGKERTDQSCADEDQQLEVSLLLSQDYVRTLEVVDASTADPHVQKTRSFINLDLQPGSMLFPTGCLEDKDWPREQSTDPTCVDPPCFSAQPLPGRWPSPSPEREPHRNELNSLQFFSLKQSISPHVFTLQKCSQGKMLATEGLDFCCCTQQGINHPLSSCAAPCLFHECTRETLLTREMHQLNNVLCPIEHDRNFEQQLLQTESAFCDVVDSEAAIPTMKTSTFVDSSHISSSCPCIGPEPQHKHGGPASHVGRQSDMLAGQGQFEGIGNVSDVDGEFCGVTKLSQCFSQRSDIGDYGTDTDQFCTNEMLYRQYDSHHSQEHLKTQEEVATKAYVMDQTFEHIHMNDMLLCNCGTIDPVNHLDTHKEVETRAYASTLKTLFDDMIDGSNKVRSEVLPANVANMEDEQQRSPESSSEVSEINVRNMENKQQSILESGSGVSSESDGSVEGEKQSNLYSRSKVSFTSAGNVEDEQQTAKESRLEVSVRKTGNGEMEKQSTIESSSELPLPNGGNLGCVQQSKLEFSTEVTLAIIKNMEDEQESSLVSRLELPSTNAQYVESDQHSSLEPSTEVAPVSSENTEGQQQCSHEFRSEVSPGNNGNEEGEQQITLGSKMEVFLKIPRNMEGKQQSSLEPSSGAASVNAENAESEQESTSEVSPGKNGNTEGEQQISKQSRMEVCLTESEQVSNFKSSAELSLGNNGNFEGEQQIREQVRKEVSLTNAQNMESKQQSSLDPIPEVSQVNAKNTEGEQHRSSESTSEVCPRTNGNMEDEKQSSLKSTSELSQTNVGHMVGEQRSSLKSTSELSQTNMGNMVGEQRSSLKSTSELSQTNMGSIVSEQRSSLKSRLELSPTNAEIMESKQQSSLKSSSQPCPANTGNLEGHQQSSLVSNLKLSPNRAGDLEDEHQSSLKSSSEVSSMLARNMKGEQQGNLESIPTGDENMKGKQLSSLESSSELSSTNAKSMEGEQQSSLETTLKVSSINAENRKGKLENSLESTSERYRDLFQNPTFFIHIPYTSTVEILEQSQSLATEHSGGMAAEPEQLNPPPHVCCDSSALGKNALRYLEHIEHHHFMSQTKNQDTHDSGMSPLSNKATLCPVADVGAHSDTQHESCSAYPQPDSQCDGEGAESASGLTPDLSSSQTHNCSQQTEPGSTGSPCSALPKVLNVAGNPQTVLEVFGELELVIDTLLKILNPEDARTQPGYQSFPKASPGRPMSYPFSTRHSVNMECSSQAANITKNVHGLSGKIRQKKARIRFSEYS